jgi:hypothetical protein
MNYVDAGYAVGLSALFLYSVGLVLRRRSLERRVELVPPRSDVVAPPTDSGTASEP